MIKSYNPKKVKLAGNAPIGGSLDAVLAITESDGKVGLSYAIICYLIR